MYIINEYGEASGYLYYAGTTDLQSGDLNMDYLYNENRKYTYDVTSYIKSLLDEGKSSVLTLVLHPPSDAKNSAEQRLVLKALNNSSFKLKINLLAL